MISDGGPAMNFGHVDCSDSGGGSVQATVSLDHGFARTRSPITGRGHRQRRGADTATTVSDRPAPCAAMLHQMFKSRVVFVGVPPQTLDPRARAVHRRGSSRASRRARAQAPARGWRARRQEQRRVRRARRFDARLGSAQPGHRQAPRRGRARQLRQGEAPSCVMHNPPSTRSSDRAPRAPAYYNIARWRDPNYHMRPREMMCDPNPCARARRGSADEAISRAPEKTGRSWRNTNRCITDRVYAAHDPRRVRALASASSTKSGWRDSCTPGGQRDRNAFTTSSTDAGASSTSPTGWRP